MSETQPYIDTPIDFLMEDDDLVITDGDLHLSSGLAGVTEAVDGAVRLALGEWFLEDTAGVDWFGSILGKGINLLVVNQLLREAILSVPFVVSVDQLTMDHDTPTRDLQVNFRATCSFGVVEGSTLVGL